MIGVISTDKQRPAAEEFFELFKTPWEPWRHDSQYDVVVATDPGVSLPTAKVAIIFGSGESPFDRQCGINARRRACRGNVVFDGRSVPIYRGLATFEGAHDPLFSPKEGMTAGISFDLPGRKILRIGYDLFEEIDFLLRDGQPVENAQIPTLELHISMLRKWIVDAGVPLVEIPPSPYGYDFMTCLTHDIDFMGIRDHKFDHSMLGFVYRSVVPCYMKGLNLRSALMRYLRNVKALCSLPFVHLGLLPDFWNPLKTYPKVERDLKSTYFFIPYRNYPGKPQEGKPAKYRAARYELNRYEEPIRDLIRDGGEVGLHGIDGWTDSRKGREELEAIRRVTGGDKIGVRMHWLYFSDETPKCLGEAGAYYDSTLGYNDAVGFRSGTTQVFRLPGASTVFELPLHAQDTAMLYPGRMGISESDAIELCGMLIKDMKDYGGALTLNWHDRSMAPERNWDSAYLAVLRMLRLERTWFSTAGEAVAWFEKRRSIRFQRTEAAGNGVPRVNVQAVEAGNGPSLTLRVHRPTQSSNEAGRDRGSFVDYPLNPNRELAAGF